MKNLLFNRNFALAICMVFAMMFVISSCSKDKVKESNISLIQPVESLEHSKVLELVDETGMNSIKFKISSKDISLVEQYNLNSFTLNTSTEDLIENRDQEDSDNIHSHDKVDYDDTPTLNQDDIEKNLVVIEILDKKMSGSVKNIGFQINNSNLSSRAYSSVGYRNESGGMTVRAYETIWVLKYWTDVNGSWRNHDHWGDGNQNEDWVKLTYNQIHAYCASTNRRFAYVYSDGHTNNVDYRIWFC